MDMRFMVAVRVEIPPEHADEARALLPAEGERAEEHLKQGILEAIYTDATDEATPATQVWAVMRADSLEAAQRLVEEYPMHEFFHTTYTILSE